MARRKALHHLLMKPPHPRRCLQLWQQQKRLNGRDSKRCEVCQGEYWRLPGAAAAAASSSASETDDLPLEESEAAEEPSSEEDDLVGRLDGRAVLELSLR